MRLVNGKGATKVAVEEDKMSVRVSLFLKEKEAGGIKTVDK